MKWHEGNGKVPPPKPFSLVLSHLRPSTGVLRQPAQRLLHILCLLGFAYIDHLPIRARRLAPGDNNEGILLTAILPHLQTPDPTNNLGL